MLFVGLSGKVVDIEFLAEPGIKFADANFDFGTQRFERLDALQKLAAELLLRGFRQRGHLADRDF